MKAAAISCLPASKGQAIRHIIKKHSHVFLRLSCLLFLSIALMVVDHRYASYSKPIHQALSWIVWPFQYVIEQPFRLGNAIASRLGTQHTLIRENQELRAKQSLLEFQLQRLEALENENIRLHTLLGSTSQAGDKAEMAEILHVAAHPFAQRVVLDKGDSDGVYEGQPVVDAYGVIGQIRDVSHGSSVVLLISDITHALPVQSNDDGTRAIAVGTGSPYELELSYVPNSAEFEVGDLLVTSGLGDRFPRGYPVGTITEIESDPGAAFMRIKVKPAARLDKVREVLLVWPGQNPTVAHVEDIPVPTEKTSEELSENK